MIYQATALRREFVRGTSTIRALDGIDLAVEQGEHLALVGPSGSGKTTLLHVLGLLDSGFGGRLVFQGQDITKLDSRGRARLRLQAIGVVYQGFHLLKALDVLDNVALPCWRLHGARKPALAKAAHLLAALGLEQRLHHQVNRLSAGEMQRVAIARALINDPSVVLADEPTGNLDAASTAAVLELFAQIPAQGRTLIIITHDLAVEAAAHRSLHLRYGKLSPVTTACEAAR